MKQYSCVRRLKNVVKNYITQQEREFVSGLEVWVVCEAEVTRKGLASLLADEILLDVGICAK